MSSQPKFLDQVRDVLRLRHYSYETEKSYISYLAPFLISCVRQ
ncbi:MAG: hypothetical protein HC800_10215 [Phormidesmis sp. RL_2_1]|nr:hypothetical protein [Phormidesmis sp. RL_2_1]